MATNTDSFVQQLKEMRALRLQQIRQQSADQRYQTSMLNYQRSVLRSNEKLVSSINSLGNKLTLTVTSLVNAVSKTGGAAVGAAASGVTNLSAAIVDGLIKSLPLAIGGVFAKIFLWDSMSGDTKSKLSSSFGKLFSKLFSFVENTFDGLVAGIIKTVQQIKKAYDDLDLRFPMLDKIGKKLSVFFDIISESMKVVSSYAQDLFDFAKENPKTAIAAALGAYLSPQILAILGSIVAGVVTTTIFKGVMTRQLSQLLAAGGGGVGAMATGRTLGESMGARGAAEFAEKAGVSLAENVFVGEAGKAIVDASGRPILRTSPAMTTGQRVTAGMRAIGSQALTVAGKGLNVAGVALLALEPSGGNISFESWEDDRGVGMLNSKDNPKRREFMSSDSDPNMVALAYALRDAGNERLDNKDLRPGSVLVVSKRWVYRAKGTGKGDQVAFVRMMVGTISKETIDFPDVYVERRDTYEKMVNDLKTRLMRDNEVQIAPGTDTSTVTGSQTTRTSGESISGLAGFIQRYESGPAGYNQMFLNPKTGKPFVDSGKPITEMTVGEIKKLQAEQVRMTREAGIGKSDKTGKVVGTGAIGRYQFTETTLAALLSTMGVKDDAIFDKALQDKLFVSLIGRAYQQYMDGTIDVDEFTKIMKGQWEAFRTPKAEKELREYLVAMKKESGTESARLISEEGKIIPKTEIQRKKALDRIKELLPELTKDDGILETPLITSRGVDVIESVRNKVGDYMDERSKSIREQMKGKYSESDPEALKNTLVDTLRITRDVIDLQKLEAGDGMNAPHSTVINNITNNNTSSSSAGASKDVYPVMARNKFEHKTLAGLA